MSKIEVTSENIVAILKKTKTILRKIGCDSNYIGKCSKCGKNAFAWVGGKRLCKKCIVNNFKNKKKI